MEGKLVRAEVTVKGFTVKIDENGVFVRAPGGWFIKIAELSEASSTVELVVKSADGSLAGLAVGEINEWSNDSYPVDGE